MASFANITINDGAASPVAITFTPDFRNGNEVVWADRRQPSSLMWPRITLAYDRASRRRPTYHVDFRVEMPIIRNIDGVDTVTDTARFERGRYILPVTMTEQERKHLRAYVANGLSNATIKGAVELLDPVF